MRKMTVKSGFDIADLPDLFTADPERIELAKQRQIKLWKGEKPDAWPIGFYGSLTEQQEQIPSGNFQECYYDDELMLCNEFRGACAVANSGSDYVPSMRANLGTGICLSTIGLEQQVFPDKMPWLQDHLNREQVAALKPEDIQIQGSFERGLRQMEVFKAASSCVGAYCMDTQGPFDLAHLILGDDIFLLMYDDPGLLHHLLEFSVEMGIKVHMWMKEVSGEGTGECLHSNGLYAQNMGIRICEDTSTLLRGDGIETFVTPYTARLAEAFDGGWVHYCGRNDALTKAMIECPWIRGIDFGIIPGRLYEHDFDTDMELIARNGKIFCSVWTRYEDESGQDYLRRLHRWAKEGAIFVHGGQAIGEHGFERIADAQDFWYSL
jgi:hypothetical protein